MTDRRFNPEMMVLARESRGYTQSQLSEETGIGQSDISKIETGFRQPTDDQLEVLARLLKYPRKFFFIGESPRGFGSGCVYNRRRKSISVKDVRTLLALANVRRIQMKGLFLAAEPAQSKFFHQDIEDLDFGGPERIAKMVRVAWGIPLGPVQNLTREIERAGAIVMRCDFGTRKVDALSQWLPGIPPLFFVNMHIPADRLRFTLAHELGHIIMHRIPTEDMEREADQFAAEFLMPKADIKPDLFEIDLRKLASLKRYWKVSMNALLKRACDLGTIEQRRKYYLWSLMAKHGYRTREPVSIEHEEPRTLKEIIEIHTRQLGYSVSDLAEVMLANEEEIRSTYLSHDRKLRLVM